MGWAMSDTITLTCPDQPCYGCDASREAWWFFGAAGADGETDGEMDAGECCWECLPDALDGKWAGDVRSWYPGLRMVWAEWAGDSEKGASFEVWLGPKGRWTATDGNIDRRKNIRRHGSAPGEALRKLQTLFAECGGWHSRSAPAPGSGGPGER